MGIYDGMEDEIRKSLEDSKDFEKKRELTKKELKRVKEEMTLLVNEAIDGYAEMARKVGVEPSSYRRNLLFIPSVIPFKAWRVYKDYCITTNGTICIYTNDYYSRFPKKALVRLIVDHLFFEKGFIDISYDSIKTWDYEADVKSFFKFALSGK